MLFNIKKNSTTLLPSSEWWCATNVISTKIGTLDILDNFSNFLFKKNLCGKLSGSTFCRNHDCCVSSFIWGLITWANFYKKCYQPPHVEITAASRVSSVTEKRAHNENCVQHIHICELKIQDLFILFAHS